MTRAGLRHLTDADPLVIRYETLCRTPRPQIARLGTYLTNAAPEDWLAAAERLPRLPRSRADALDPSDREALARACAPGEAAIRRWRDPARAARARVATRPGGCPRRGT